MIAVYAAAPTEQPYGTLYLARRLGIGIPPCDYARSAYPGNMCNGVFTAESVGGLPLNETTTAEALSGAGCELSRCFAIGIIACAR